VEDVEALPLDSWFDKHRLCHNATSFDLHLAAIGSAAREGDT
jgi:hypothetical protein